MKPELLEQYYREKIINLIYENTLNTPNFEEVEKKIKKLFDDISNENNKTILMQNLLIDLINDDPNHGQVEKAFRKEYYLKWGLNYLLSFLRFHITEQCGNFKDQSLQQYGSEEFESMRKFGNKIFINLPPPESESKKENKVDDFVNLCYNFHGGCFNGDAFVKLKNGKIEKVRNLKKGDILINGAKVECLIKNIIEKEEIMVEINGVFFSPYHPVEINNKWIFPIEYFKPVKKYIDAWFNLVLNKKHEVILNGIKAITLGHNRSDGILKHPYFGTEKVIKALKKYDGYKNGLIITHNIESHLGEDNLIESYY